MEKKDWIKYSLIGVVLFLLAIGIVSFVLGNINIFEWESSDRLNVIGVWIVSFYIFGISQLIALRIKDY